MLTLSTIWKLYLTEGGSPLLDLPVLFPEVTSKKGPVPVECVPPRFLNHLNPLLAAVTRYPHMFFLSKLHRIPVPMQRNVEV